MIQGSVSTYPLLAQFVYTVDQTHAADSYQKLEGYWFKSCRRFASFSLPMISDVCTMVLGFSMRRTLYLVILSLMFSEDGNRLESVRKNTNLIYPHPLNSSDRPQSMRVYTIMPQSHEMWQDLLEALNVDDVSEYDICKGMESVLKDVNIPPFGCSQIPKFPKNGEEKSVKIYIAECKNTEAKVSTDIKTKIHQALNVEASLPVNVTSK
ncbi:hypothetical protein CRM22_010890 [Opisthorchis felineus]|uniref:Uncharacterized protein n=1 Tax=Opisthorchis felineus TaxID=147828 RepID=A0A4S2KQ44_OPIFE|nr:hypothetical protein CRM22_010890 [Opisthorchis felineus]